MQKRVLDVLRTDGSTHLTRARYEQLTGVSRSQAAYDLAELVEAGIIVRRGGGRATRYRLAQASQPSRAEQPGRRRWTNERIRSELERFCAQRKTWPSAAEFKAAGHSDLYVAASRYGGVGFWASELGFSRPGRTETPAPRPPHPRRELWPRLRWAAAAAVIGAAALVAAGGARIDSWHGVPTLRSSLGVPGFVPKRLPQSAVEVKRSAPPVSKKKARAKPARHVTRPRSTPAVHTSASQAELVVQRTPAPTHTAPSRTSAPPPPPPPPPSSGSGGPAPLPPPPGGTGAPQPIPPPHR